MSAITGILLRAKHWHLFCLLAVFPVVVPMAVIFPFLNLGVSSDSVWKVNLMFLLSMMPFILCFLGWLWSMGTFLNSIVPQALKMNTRFFLFALIFPPIYVSLFMVFVFLKPVVFVFLLPFHFLAMFCLLYELYFIAKNLVTAETGSAASFSDYVGSLFMIWLYPIGVWFIQPRINRLYARNLSSERSTGANAS
jgi:hypothetical protein